MNNPFQLKNKHILVTGASSTSDIGVGVSTLLANLGARLTLVGRNFDTLEETRLGLAKPDTHKSVAFDLEEVDEIPNWIKGVVASSSPFDGMVHLASHQGYSPLKTISSKQFNDYFNLNVAASLMLAKGFAKKGVFNAPASIVYMGSVAGLTGQKGRSLYGHQRRR
jgi:short-subunit dehydrogenase